MQDIFLSYTSILYFIVTSCPILILYSLLCLKGIDFFYHLVYRLRIRNVSSPSNHAVCSDFRIKPSLHKNIFPPIFYSSFNNVSTAVNSPQPKVTVPSITSLVPLSSSSVRSSRLRISNALLFNKIPSSVSIILFPLRTNRTISNSSSNAASCLDRVGCVMCSCSAAFVKLCSFAAFVSGT